MKCLSLFSGAGGLDLGLKAAGFQIVASIEQDKDCCATLLKNGHRKVVCSDVGTVDFLKIVGRNKIDVVIGGPPCQPFSKSALWTHNGARGLSDPRTKTIELFLNAVEQLRPSAFILENVEGFARLGGLQVLLDGLAQLNQEHQQYTVTSGILSAADFGVPQKRRRFFAVGLRGGTRFEFPTPTHGPGLNAYASAWDACAAAAQSTASAETLRVRGRWASLLPSIPPGKNYLWHTNRGDGEPIFGWRTRYWSFLYKLNPREPSPTIVANPSQNSGPFHWENRLLSTRELAAIQTFPAGYEFVGDRPSRQRQIGNAVPPLLAEHIGRALIEKLGKTAPSKIKFAVQQCTLEPVVPERAPVPESFQTLIGAHPDHPGAGLGPRPRPNPKLQAEGAP